MSDKSHMNQPSVLNLSKQSILTNMHECPASEPGKPKMNDTPEPGWSLVSILAILQSLGDNYAGEVFKWYISDPSE